MNSARTPEKAAAPHREMSDYDRDRHLRAAHDAYEAARDAILVKSGVISSLEDTHDAAARLGVEFLVGGVMRRRRCITPVGRSYSTLCFGGACFYCRRDPGEVEMTFDHFWPRQRYGVNNWYNLVPCCIKCNRAKDNRLPTELEVARYLAMQTRRPNERGHIL